MADSFLPPLVIGIEWDDASALAQMGAYEDRLDALAAKSDETTAAMGGGMKNVAADSDKYLAGDVAGNLQHVGDTADDTADRVHDSAGRLSSDLENIGEGAVAGSSATKGAMEDAAKGVDDAEKDVEGKSKGFSGRVSKVFSTVGNSMSSWGIPFGHTVSDMGEKIDQAESKGHGFSESLVQVGKAATAVAGVALIGFGAESIHMADEFDVANVQLQNAIKNTGGSFDSVKPQIEATYSQMSHLGFNSIETAKALTSLTISTKSPTVAMRDMSVAADLARAKNMSLEAATSTLTKVYAGSTRALTQLGLNLDVGTGKLKSIQSATESVKSAQLAYKLAQEEAASATGEKAVTADLKLQEAHLKLEQAQTKLRMDTNATGEILSAVKQRTEGAAEAYGKTLAGAVSQAKATLENFAIEVGERLIPIVTTMIGVISSATVYVLNHKAVLIALAALVAGPLSVAIGAFTVSKLVAFGQGWVKVGEIVKNFGSLVASMVQKVIGLFGTQEAAAVTLAETTGAETAQMQFDFEETGAKATAMASTVATADGAIEEANATAAASFSAMLGPIAAVTAAAGFLGYKLGEALESSSEYSGGKTKNERAEPGVNQNISKREEAENYSEGAGDAGKGHGGNIEQQILKFWESHGFSAAAAAGFVGNAAAESSLNVHIGGGGLYQQSGLGAAGAARVAEEGVTEQSQVVLERLSPSLVAALKHVKSPEEAANLIMKDFEMPAGSQPGETATTDQQGRREQVAADALKKAIETAPAAAANDGIKSAIGTTKATSAATAVKTAIETAKLNLTEAKKVFSTAFGELAKLSEKLLKYTLAKGGVKNAELKQLEEGHEAEQTKAAVANAEVKLTEAKAGGNATEIEAAQAELNSALYAQKVAALKQEAQVEEASIAKQNAAKESAFTQALAKLKAHLEKGKTTTKQGMAEIEKVLKQYGITFGTVGKDAGDEWVKQFETAIKKAALDAGGITSQIRADLSAGLHIPGLAAGGIVTAPTLAVIGEAGPEAVVPLSGLSTKQPAALGALAGGAASGGNTINLYSTVNTNATTSQQTVNEMWLRLRPLLLGV